MDDTDFRVPESAYADLAAALERQGAVRFRLGSGVVLTMAACLAGVPVAALGLATSGWLPWWLAGWALAIGVVAAPFAAEQLLARSPALLVDREGLHLRRWARPLTLRWADLHEVRSQKPRASVPRVVEAWAPWTVWDADQSSRPWPLRTLSVVAGVTPRAADVRPVRLPSVRGHRPEVLAAWLRHEWQRRAPSEG